MSLVFKSASQVYYSRDHAVCQFFAWDVSEALPKRGKSVVVAFPASSLGHPICRVTKAAGRTLEGKEHWLFEFGKYA